MVPPDCGVKYNLGTKSTSHVTKPCDGRAKIIKTIGMLCDEFF